MQAILGYLLLIAYSVGCVSPPKSFLQTKYPEGLITNDFDILTEEDLKFFYDSGNPTPIGTVNVPNFTHWICASTHKIKVYCEDFGPDFGDPKEHYGSPRIVIETGSARYFFARRRAEEIEGCFYLANKWKGMIENQTHACVAGDYVRKEPDRGDIAEYLLTFDRIKTKDSCDSYFEGGCENKDH